MGAFGATGLGIVLLALHSSLVEAGKFKCPAYTKLSPDEFLFADPDQCDKYWTCSNGNSRRSLCPDGLVYHPDKPKGEDPCDLKHNVPDKCKGREQQQFPKPGDGHCPRQNGVYASTDPYECDTYYSCLNGKSSPTKCAEGLHYSEEVGTCVWARDSGRDDCITDDSANSPQRKKKKGSDNSKDPIKKKNKPAKALDNGFQCPGGALGVHPALPHPDNCRLYYICLDGITPTDAGCTSGKVFNPIIQQCDLPKNVDGCEDHYNPAAKKKKAEIAESLGAEAGSADFSKFLKLLKMSGVLGGSTDTSILESSPKGNTINDGFPRRRPGKRNRNRRPGRRRPQRPLRPKRPKFDYYNYGYDDYDYGYEYDYPDPPRQKSKNLASSPSDDIKEKPRTSTLEASKPEGRVPGTLFTRRKNSRNYKAKETTKTVPTEVRVEEPKTSLNEEEATVSNKKTNIYAVRPDQRANRYTSKFIPRVRPIGNLENIHPTGTKEIEPTARETSSSTSTTTELNLSGSEAENIFNSLFPNVAQAPVPEKRVETLPNPAPLIASDVKGFGSVTEKIPPFKSVTRKNNPFVTRNRNSFFARQSAAISDPSPNLEAIVPEKNVDASPLEISPITKIENTPTESVKVPVRQRIFEMRNRLRSRHRFEGNIATEKSPTVAIRLDTSESSRRSAKSDQTISDEILSDIDRESSVAINEISKEKPLGLNVINRVNPEVKRLSAKERTTALLKKRPLTNLVRNRKPLRDSSPFTVGTTEAITPALIDITETIQPTEPLAPTQRTISTTPLRRRQQLISIPSKAQSPAVSFLRPHTTSLERTLPTIPPQSNDVDQPLVPAFDEQDTQPSLNQVKLQTPVHQDRSKSRQTIKFGHIKSIKTIPKTSKLTSSFLDEGEMQRMVAKRVRTKIHSLLPEGENRGDSLEKLRAKIERLKHTNPARGRG